MAIFSPNNKQPRSLDRSRRQGNQQDRMLQQRGQTRRQWRKLGVVCTVGLGLLVGTTALPRLRMLWHQRPSPTPQNAPLAPADLASMEQMAGRLLGEHVRHKLLTVPNQVVVSLVPPPAARTALEAAALLGLEQGLAEQWEQIISVELPADGRSIPGNVPWYTPAAFREALSAHSDATLIISIAGLPEPIEAFHLWEELADPPPMALLHAPPHRLGRLVQAGLISAMIVRRPGMLGSPGHGLAPDDPRHWLLLTPDNVVALSQQYENLFAQPLTKSVANF